MIRPPPRSTLFPLHDALPIYGRARGVRGLVRPVALRFRPSRRRSRDLAPPRRARRRHAEGRRAGARRSRRSEEHTSELQSHVNLVCRLLLEKKKKEKQLSKET